MESVNSLKLSFSKNSVYLNCTTLFVLLGILSVIAYFPTFFNSFQLAWDDTWQVLENPLVLDNSLQTFSSHFTHFWQRQYSPVNSLFYLLIHQLAGMNASAFHLACLLIHLLNSTLVFSISSSICSRFLPNIHSTRIQFLAFLATLIFAIHPLQVESVAWISASKIILYGLFTLTAIWSYL